MRLTEFIQANHEAIIAEWVQFATTLLPWAKGMSERALRDHAGELLTAVVSDMKAPQTSEQQAEKSQGLAAPGALTSVGQKHAAQRLATGFNLDQLVSEYRALRASILRLWADANGEEHRELNRFNEAIDESLTEATIRYSEMLGRTREQFLAILGHDLRNPLGAILMGSTMLARSERLDDKQARIAARILNSASRMNRMVSDLLDLTRTRLGAGIPVTPRAMDLAPICQAVIAELEAVHPDSHLRFEAFGDLVGTWDSDRLTQVISNLVANALQHGGEGGSVSVVAEGLGDTVALRINNHGPLIAPEAMRMIFEPMLRQPTPDGDRNSTGLGLGLYIAREIVVAHGGTIGVTSTEAAGTTFTIQMPRHPADTAQ
ncbi:HAMP domain-containing sensor histidine kinase [Nannocystis sp.]|uniref:sensor histidine kinase n=1 Tax=Nannocystis sp. TaxID=1962667 RepID=UPI0025EA2142|nr:HAMP domain-containing sensor histidine kinase [Nannocystis sp.]MBK7828720.1 HAMP domain-containing histidine kinase [Nannocystis sp.]